MFTKAKDKTKTVSLKLRAKVANNKSVPMAGNQTVSLSQIPMADTHGVIALPNETVPGLYATGKVPKPVKQNTVKKSLCFEEVTDIPKSLTQDNTGKRQRRRTRNYRTRHSHTNGSKPG